MKKLAAITKILWVTIILLASTGSVALSQNSKKEKDAAKAAAVKKMVEAGSYLFEVQSALPSGGRNINLSPGYTLKVSGDTLISQLPYYGRAYSSAGVSDGGYDFTSVDFEYEVTDRKKGGWNIDIKTKDQQENPKLVLTVFENGSASLTITTMSRQSISYSGYLSEKK